MIEFLWGIPLGASWLLAGWVGYRWGRDDAQLDATLRRLSEHLRRPR